MRKMTKKLVLAKETLHNLEPERLQKAAGADLKSEFSDCYTSFFYACFCSPD